MNNDRFQRESLNYNLYKYGKSKTWFRGPPPDMAGPYHVFLGSSETFGKFVRRPFPDILAEKLAVPCANFSAMNAGVEMYLRNPSVLLASADARATVVAVSGAHNLSNRFYSVHPHHNDRFVRPSEMLQMLYRDVEFTDIHYTRHLLNTLLRDDANKFALVVAELKAAWVARMKTLLEMLEGVTILLWAADHAPRDVMQKGETDGLGPDPLFVDQRMLDELSPLVTRVVESIVPVPQAGDPTRDMVFVASERLAAENLPGPDFHERTASVLEPVLRAFS